MTTIIPYNLITTHPDVLHYWVKLKCYGIVYNFNFRNLAGILRVSPTTAGKHFKVMQELGLVHFTGKNLVVTGNKKLSQKYRLVKTRVFRKKSAQKMAFFSLVIGDNIKKQSKRISKKLNIIKRLRSNRRITSQQYRVIRVNGGEAAFENSFNTKTMLSNKKIGRMLYRAPRTASKYQKAMKDLGLITKRANLRLVAKNVGLKKFACEVGRNMIVIGSDLYRQLPNYISVHSLSS